MRNILDPDQATEQSIMDPHTFIAQSRVGTYIKVSH